MGLEAHLLFSLNEKFWISEYSWYANITGLAQRPGWPVKESSARQDG